MQDTTAMTILGTCVTCNTPISAGEMTCGACRTAVGLPLAAWRNVGVAVGVTVASYGFLHLFVSHVGMLGLAMFYGALSAAYFARENALVPSALGSIGGSLVVALVYIFDAWDKFGPYAARQLGLAAPNLGITLLALVPVALVALLPIALGGAAAGELLAQRRRQRVV